MEKINVQDTTIKRVVPIKGNILEKLKNHLHQKKNSTLKVAESNDSTNNNLNGNMDPVIKKEVQTSDGKAVIHAVEKVQIDLTAMLPKNKPGVDPNQNTSNDEKTNNLMPNKQQSSKILSAKMPENICNVSIPLKMIRKIRQPVKPTPVLQRISKVSVHINPTNVNHATVSNETSIRIVDVSSNAIEKMEEQKRKSPEFCGFNDDDRKADEEFLNQLNQVFSQETSSNSNLNDDKAQEIKKAIKDETQSILKSVCEKNTSDTFEESQVITDSMVNSSMMREFAADLNETSLVKNSDNESLESYMDDSEISDDDTQSEIIDADEVIWLNDIVELIGEPRIREIDKSLKKIPSIATGNKIETENIELKLIINHLLKKLKANSVTETLHSESVPQLPTPPISSPFNEIKKEILKHTENDDFSSDHFDNDYSDMENDNEKETTSFTITELLKPTTLNKQNLADENNEIVDMELEEEHPSQQQQIPKEAAEEKLETSKEDKIRSNLKRKNTLLPLAASTVKKMKPKPRYDMINIENEEQKLLSRQLSELEAMTKNKTPKRTQKSIKSSGPVHHNRPRCSSKLNEYESSSLSTSISTNDNIHLKNELKLLVSTNDNSNSTQSNKNKLHSSNNLVKTKEFCEETQALISKVKEVVERKKSSDPTYREPEIVEKRPYLITSAFVGNNSNNPTNSTSSTPDDSTIVCKKSKNAMTGATKSLKEVMNLLINSANPPQLVLPAIPKEMKKNSKKKVKVLVKKKVKPEGEGCVRYPARNLIKKVFVQEKLEETKNHLVPYDKIIESIRVSNPPRGKKSGKALWIIPEFKKKEREKILKDLEKLEHFKCGMCGFLVNKHKWKKHLESHGFFAFIEGFEKPLNILEWNEALRRLMQYTKIYGIESFVCPHCNQSRKSALGHLSHLYICGEDDDTVEQRKINCEVCGNRFLPFNLPHHKKSCFLSDKNVKNEVKEEEESDNEREKTLSGRFKRKAVKKAEQKFKSIIDNEKTEHIAIINEKGEARCYICSENFPTQEKAYEHLKNVHDIDKNERDFSASSSDEYDKNKSESSESEDESSGVDEDEQSDKDFEDNSCKNSTIGKVPYTESQESKNSRIVVSSYVDRIRNDTGIFNRIFDMTVNFKNVVLNSEIYANANPKFKTVEIDLTKFLSQMNFTTKSMHFLANETSHYAIDFNISYMKEDWNQIDVGKEFISENQTRIFYCGGIVSSIDWAPSNSDKHFLAVACNSSNEKIGLVQTTKSCVQIYEFQPLVNDKIHNFDKITSSLLYAFSISTGPILSLKFHPCGVPSTERIGILAVTTSQQDVFIYSLPYLNNAKVIHPEPLFIACLEEEAIFYQDNFLLQASCVTWHYEKNRNNILIVGYINGYVALFNMKDNMPYGKKYPYIVFQAHHESIVGVDTKVGKNGQFYLLTASLGRDIKIYSIDTHRYEEVSVVHGSSRTLCAQFLLNWSAYVYGNDNCYSLSGLLLRQPFDFVNNKNINIMKTGTSIISLDICHFTNSFLFTTSDGDVLSCRCMQFISNHNVKDPWKSHKNAILSFTDYCKIDNENSVKFGIIFNDLSSNFEKKPKKIREAPAEFTNQLQINQVRFNHNVQSHRFYALAYESGFIRIKHLKLFTT